MNKFHDRKSLCAGVVMGVMLVVVGLVLGLHCLDMLRYYKKHRIIKIVKKGNEKLVYKEEDAKQDKGVA